MPRVKFDFIPVVRKTLSVFWSLQFFLPDFTFIYSMLKTDCRIFDKTPLQVMEKASRNERIRVTIG